MAPVVTLMIGRLDDWFGSSRARRDRADPRLRALVRRRRPQAGLRGLPVAGFRARLLAAAYRHHLHWSELIGGDIVLTIPYAWQRRFNGSDSRSLARMDDPVPDEIVTELYRRFPDFVRAFDPDGMTVEEFDTFGPTARTLRAFIGSYQRPGGPGPRRPAPEPRRRVGGTTGPER